MAKIVSVTQRGNFQKTDRFLHSLIGAHYERKLHHYGKMGVSALAEATPHDSKMGSISPSFCNTGTAPAMADGSRAWITSTPP